MWHQEFNEEDLGVTEDNRHDSDGRSRMYGQTRPYNLKELFEKQIIAFYNTELKARRLDLHGNPCNDDATGKANCDRVEDVGFQNDKQNTQTHQQYAFDPTKITYWMKMARLQHFMDASKNDKYLTKGGIPCLYFLIDRLTPICELWTKNPHTGNMVERYLWKTVNNCGYLSTNDAPTYSRVSGTFVLHDISG